MAGQRDEVDFLSHSKVDNRPHHRTHGHMHVRSYAFLSQARLKSFEIVSSILKDSVDYFWIHHGRDRI